MMRSQTIFPSSSISYSGSVQLNDAVKAQTGLPSAALVQLFLDVTVFAEHACIARACQFWTRLTPCATLSICLKDARCCMLSSSSSSSVLREVPCHYPAQTHRQSAPTPSECTHEFCQLHHCNSLLNFCFIGTRHVH